LARKAVVGAAWHQWQSVALKYRLSCRGCVGSTNWKCCCYTAAKQCKTCGWLPFCAVVAVCKSPLLDDGTSLVRLYCGFGRQLSLCWQTVCLLTRCYRVAEDVCFCDSNTSIVLSDGLLLRLRCEHAEVRGSVLLKAVK
jgi:hypothetical protein